MVRNSASGTDVLLLFVSAAAQSSTGMAGAQGVWSGLPVNVVYVPHEENKNTAVEENKPRFQYLDGYTAEGDYVGSAYEMDEKEEYSSLSIHDNLIVIFSRCTHLCCIPGWQLVQNDYTNDTWIPGGIDSGGTNYSASVTLADLTRQQSKRIVTGTDLMVRNSSTSGLRSRRSSTSRITADSLHTQWRCY